ncbi:hypothetical protein ACOME3_006392 [Neoechinorhynchus agilis]
MSEKPLSNNLGIKLFAVGVKMDVSSLYSSQISGLASIIVLNAMCSLPREIGAVNYDRYKISNISNNHFIVSVILATLSRHYFIFECKISKKTGAI